MPKMKLSPTSPTTPATPTPTITQGLSPHREDRYGERFLAYPPASPLPTKKSPQQHQHQQPSYPSDDKEPHDAKERYPKECRDGDRSNDHDGDHNDHNDHDDYASSTSSFSRRPSTMVAVAVDETTRRTSSTSVVLAMPQTQGGDMSRAVDGDVGGDNYLDTTQNRRESAMTLSYDADRRGSQAVTGRRGTAWLRPRITTTGAAVGVTTAITTTTTSTPTSLSPPTLEPPTSILIERAAGAATAATLDTLDTRGTRAQQPPVPCPMSTTIWSPLPPLPTTTTTTTTTSSFTAPPLSPFYTSSPTVTSPFMSTTPSSPYNHYHNNHNHNLYNHNNKPTTQPYRRLSLMEDVDSAWELERVHADDACSPGDGIHTSKSRMMGKSTSSKPVVVAGTGVVREGCCPLHTRYRRLPKLQRTLVCLSVTVLLLILFNSIMLTVGVKAIAQYAIGNWYPPQFDIQQFV